MTGNGGVRDSANAKDELCDIAKLASQLQSTPGNAYNVVYQIGNVNFGGINCGTFCFSDMMGNKQTQGNLQSLPAGNSNPCLPTSEAAQMALPATASGQ